MSSSCSTDLPQIRLRPFFLVMLEITMNRCENGNLSVLLYSLLVISFTVLEERSYMVLLKLTNVYLPLLCYFYVFSINNF